jgi:hypothetical protein
MLLNLFYSNEIKSFILFEYLTLIEQTIFSKAGVEKEKLEISLKMETIGNSFVDIDYRLFRQETTDAETKRLYPALKFTIFNGLGIDVYKEQNEYQINLKIIKEEA